MEREIVASFTGKPLTKYYEQYAKVGQGRFGAVTKAFDKKNNKYVAMKRILWGELTDGIHIATIEEIKLLRELDHENIIKLVDVVTLGPENDVYLVFDYCEYDIKSFYMEHPTYLSINQAISYMRQMLIGLYACHARHIIHRDIKPENILLTKNNIIKVADFNLAKKYPPKVPKKYDFNVITLYYKPPEILLGTPTYDKKIDVWSLGCTFYEMMTKRVLFKSNPKNADDIESQIKCVFEICGYPDQSWPEWKNFENAKWVLDEAIANRISRSPGLEAFLKRTLPAQFQNSKDLLLQMLEMNPAKRCSVEEAFCHPYLRNVNGAFSPQNLPILDRREVHIEMMNQKENHSQDQQQTQQQQQQQKRYEYRPNQPIPQQQYY